MDKTGFKTTLDLYFPKLMGQSLGAALHPLIHIGYAAEFSDPLILTEGLAYACISPLKNTNLILDGIATKATITDNCSVVSLLKELNQCQLTELPNDIGNFHHKTQFLLEHHGDTFQNMIARYFPLQSFTINKPLKLRN